MKPWQSLPLERSFDALYERWFDDVTRWVRALGAREADCDDVVQEVFLVVHRRLAEFDGQNPGAWIYQIARRKVRDQARLLWVKRLFRHDCVPLSEVMATQRSPLEELETKQKRELLVQLIGRLSEDQRKAFVLFQIEGTSGEHIARLDGVSVNTVWARLFKARKKLQRELQRADVTVEDRPVCA